MSIQFPIQLREEDQILYNCLFTTATNIYIHIIHLTTSLSSNPTATPFLSQIHEAASKQIQLAGDAAYLYFSSPSVENIKSATQHLKGLVSLQRSLKDTENLLLLTQSFFRR